MACLHIFFQHDYPCRILSRHFQYHNEYIFVKIPFIYHNIQNIMRRLGYITDLELTWKTKPQVLSCQHKVNKFITVCWDLYSQTYQQWNETDYFFKQVSQLQIIWLEDLLSNQAIDVCKIGNWEFCLLISYTISKESLKQQWTIIWFFAILTRMTSRIYSIKKEGNFRYSLNLWCLYWDKIIKIWTERLAFLVRQWVKCSLWCVHYPELVLRPPPQHIDEAL